jgi:ribosomal protein S12 methylthiotransferase
LPVLLGRLAQLKDLRWVRVLYAYPNRVTPRLLETMAKYPRLAKYLDMPLQHASRSVLARMRRGASGDAFLKLLERTRAAIPGIALRTSFIVGFPGETETDFRELSDFIRAAEFDWMGVFCYSDMEDARSFGLDTKVDPEIAAERRDRLMAMQRKISARKLRKRIGQRLPALLEGPSKESELIWEARLEGMAPEIDGKLYITDVRAALDGTALETGSFVRVEITEAHDYDLVGRVVEVVEAPRQDGRRAAAPGALRPVPAGASLRILA